jgi:GntR family transcriptional regulator
LLEDRKLDKNTPIPLYFQLEKLIMEEIEGGDYPVGSLIPTEKELSRIFDISRTTVRQAIANLVRRELLYRVKSKGTFVSSPKVGQVFIQSVHSFNDDIRSAGKVPSTEVLEMKVVDLPKEIMEQVGASLQAKAIYLYRRRYADDSPIVRVETYLPYEPCSFVLDHDFSRESLYEVLSQKRDTNITHVVRTCEACCANADDMTALGMNRGKPVLHFVTWGYNKVGDLIEFSIARCRGDQSKFKVEVDRV